MAGGDIARWLADIFLILIRVILFLGILVVSPVILLLLVSWPWLQGQASTSPIMQEIGREISRLVQFFSMLLVDLSRFMQGFFESMPDLRHLRGWLIGGTLAALFLMLLFWFGRRWDLPWRRGKDLNERSSQLDLSQVRKRLAQSFWGRLKNLGTRVRQAHIRPGLLGAIRIRLLYARLMRLCEDLGTPREPTSTPLEFLTLLSSLLPQSREETRVMTEAYNKVRYGELPETRAEVEAVEQAWRRVRLAGARQRQVQRQLQVNEDPTR
jgi:hypothetical protein